MGLKESLKKLQEDEKISVKREVKKEMTKIKKEMIQQKKCYHCYVDAAKYFVKGTNEGYCKECAIELFGTVDNLIK
jgi:hypothetical protein